MSQLPTINKATQALEQVVSKPPKPKESQFELKVIRIPFHANAFEGYFSNRVDMTLTIEQAKVLKAILFGLQAKYARLANGKEVANGQDAIKWLLENVS